MGLGQNQLKPFVDIDGLFGGILETELLTSFQTCGAQAAA